MRTLSRELVDDARRLVWVASLARQAFVRGEKIVATAATTAEKAERKVVPMRFTPSTKRSRSVCFGPIAALVLPVVRTCPNLSLRS